jgi:hypothetical protein
MRAKIDVSEFNLTANYQRIPYRLKIKEGQFAYDGKKVGVQNLGGILGKSSFSGMTAQLRFGKEPYLEILSGASLVFMDEIYPWLLSYKTLKDALKDFKSVQGEVSLSTIQVNGPLLKPKEWKYRTSGEVKRLNMDSTYLPDTIFVTKGNLEANEDTLTFKDMQANLLDASFSLSGVLHDLFEGLNTADVTGGGKMGPKGTKWVSNVINLPSELSVRAPVVVSNAHLVHEKGIKTFFDGDFALPRDQEVSVELLKNPEGFMINELLVSDKESRASLAFGIKEKELSFTFKGNMTQNTIDNIFQDTVLQKEWIQGDFRAHILTDEPELSVFHGTLQGKDIVFPWKLKEPLIINSISLAGEDNTIDVDSAVFTLGNRHITVEGEISASEEGFLLNLDLSADALDLDIIDRIFDRGSDTVKEERYWDIPVRGTLRVKAESFTHDRVTWRPVHTDVSFAPGKVNLNITDARLCGISLPGVLIITPQDVSMDFQLTAENEDLESAILCLLDKKGLITGSFDLKGNVMTRGKGKNLRKSFNGSIVFTAQKGRIYRGGVLAKIFAFMNLSEVFTGTLPDMVNKGFGYKTISAQGTLQGSTLLLKEVIIDGSSMEIINQGDVDLIDKTLDLVVLVAPLKTVDRFAKFIPVVKDITGGTIVTIPLKVTGDYDDPKITYLPVSAIGSGVYGILKKTLKVPFKIIQPVMPNKENPDQGSNIEMKKEK